MQPKELRDWCRIKYGAQWYDCDPAIKKQRLSEAKKELGKPYAKKPSTNVGSGVKTLVSKPLAPMKPVWFMRQYHEDDGREDKYYGIPSEVAVSLGIQDYISKAKIKGREQPTGGTTTFWNVWITLDDEENTITAGGDPNPGYGDRHCYVDFGDWSADDVLLSMCTGGYYDKGFPTQLEEGGWHDGTEWTVYNNKVIVGAEVWRLASEETRAKFLRECFATTVYILSYYLFRI